MDTWILIGIICKVLAFIGQWLIIFWLINRIIKLTRQQQAVNAIIERILIRINHSRYSED